ncbi:MAG: AAA-like domain-containing protein [Cyanobacteria bacterium P01_D01_bin.105]
MGPTKILILAANPSNTTQLRLPEEVREIQEGLALSEGREQFEVISQWAVRPDDLRRSLLKHKPQIVHFSGHGADQQGLVFENESGQSTMVQARTLAKLFKLCPGVKCVVLNACYSKTQSRAIAKHVDYVIGMSKAIGDRAAIKFAVGFYDALGYGRPIAEAFEFGLLAIDLDNIPESETPVLHSRLDSLPERDIAAQTLPTTADPAVEVPSAALEIREQRAVKVVDMAVPIQPVTLQQTAQTTPVTNGATGVHNAANPIKAIDLEEPEGLVPLDSPFYIERSPIESDCYEAVQRRGSLIRIKAPRQMGKTSLLIRVLDQAKQQGYETVRMSLQTADEKALDDLNEFLQWFCCLVTEELDLPDRLADYWKGSRGTVRRCQRYFENYLLTEVKKPILLGLDEVDQVFEHPKIATDFFGMLRVWHEEGKSDPMWAKLHLVIVHSKEVYVPLSINRSPFNVGVPIELRELNHTERLDLIARHQLEFSAAELQQLLSLVGGHPFLLRMALHRIARGRMTLEQLLAQAPTEGGLYNDHLRRHLLNIEADPELAAAFTQVILAKGPVQIGSTEAFKLNSMGLVKYEGNSVVPLCELYRQYFQTRL